MCASIELEIKPQEFNAEMFGSMYNVNHVSDMGIIPCPFFLTSQEQNGVKFHLLSIIIVIFAPSEHSEISFSILHLFLPHPLIASHLVSPRSSSEQFVPWATCTNVK